MICGSRQTTCLLTDLRYWLLAGLATLACGCGNSGEVKVYPISGEAFVAGRPLAGALIHLHPVKKDGPPPAFAKVQPNGDFRLTTYREGDGAAEGEYAVTISWSDEWRNDDETIVGPDKLQERYTKADRSGLKATIVAGANKPLRFDLK
jgi:hypothetical protein